MSAASKLRGLAKGKAKRDNEKSSAISEERFAATLGTYAGMVGRVLDQPERWLGAEAPEDSEGSDGKEESKESGGKIRHAAQAARRAVVGDVHPGSSDWEKESLKARTRWWLRRIAATAGTAAAVPRVAGMLADRLPVQAALGASASGMAVCATARENGIEDPDDWVPLLAQVIFDRELTSAAGTAPDAQASEQALTAGSEELGETDDDGARSAMSRLGGGGQRAVGGMWHLARTLLELQGLFDERPHGGFLARTVAHLPVVGVLGGWADERGAISTASRETQNILDAR